MFSQKELHNVMVLACGCEWYNVNYPLRVPWNSEKVLLREGKRRNNRQKTKESHFDDEMESTKQVIK